ncbi:uncharacterized protein DNG_06995 [Cephalotrichum gorgonifer]|uniref:DUF6536 domain-containing protein n=1 Tax=Cephalotrichum gorgonifer TaxID=2041049 RepID=A0AAE8N1N8_9PEZI|nr:uncharacterized protein DNG_06995 [Cephalotrichum gorgonifer]
MAGHSKSRATGWRQPAIVNTILLAFLSLGLFITTFFAGNETQSYTINLLFYAGDCETTRLLDLGIHLALNIVATLTFSSSIFFMQVLNSPTREEVDAAHAKGKSVEIGVPSLSNLLGLSRFKGFTWVVLAVFSLPVHLLFNSAVFQTDFHGKSWNLTVAAEPFVDGAGFFLPGASLAIPGFDEGYGGTVDVAEFLNESSPAVAMFRTTASTVGTWKRLDAATCRGEYLRCNPRQDFKDVVLVVNTDGEDNTLGWTRTEVFDMGSRAAAQWDRFVPAEELNSLWFSATCEMAMEPGIGPGACTNSCGRALGSDFSLGNDSKVELMGQGATWVIPFQDRQVEPGGESLSDLSREGFRFDRFNNLEVRYCLAQEFQQTCKLGASPLLLGISALCVGIVATQCLFVLRSLSADLLVTPGDAIASFISDPDPTTEGMSTLSFQDRTSPLSRLWKKRAGLALSGPREWSRRPKYAGATIPAATWLLTYLFLSGSLVTLAFSYFRFGMRALIPGSFAHSPENGHMRSMDVPDGAFILALLMGNKTQVFLATSYYLYNALLTRFMAEREWNAYSLAYQALRVTSPKGSQTSTHRLQLPYKLGVPLIVIASLLHWTLSNTYYLSIFEEGYFGSDRKGLRDIEDDVGLAPDTTITLSYSVKALLGISIVSFVLMLIPVLIAFTKLRGDMVISGANSRVISAACHPRLFVNVASVNFRSPWSDGEKGGLTIASPRSPRDTRSLYRSRTMSNARSVEQDNWPLSNWAQDTPNASAVPPSPYWPRSPTDVGGGYRSRAMSEATVRVSQVDAQGLSFPPSPYGIRSPGDRRSMMYRPRTMSESTERRPSQVMIHDGQRLMPPPSPYDPRSPGEGGMTYRPRSMSGASEGRPYGIMTNENQSLTPPYPYDRTHADPYHQPPTSEFTEGRRPSDRPPSEWGKQKFEPNHDHGAPPKSASLEPPPAPWVDSFSEEGMSPLVQKNRLTESRRRETGLRIITPASPTHRKLPWSAETDPLSTPATPRLHSAVPQFIEKEGSAREKGLRKLAQRKLRWGAMAALDRYTSPHMFSEKAPAGSDGRLGFGSVECGVSTPEVGRFYD